jgi:hypothetical protein
MRVKPVLVACAVFFAAGAGAWFATALWTDRGTESESAPTRESPDPLAQASLLVDSMRRKTAETQAREVPPLPPVDVAALPPVEGPRLTVSLENGTGVLDVGPVRHGTAKQAILRVVNTGTKPLTISGTTSSCNCLHVAEGDTRDPIEPGAERLLSVVFQASSGSGGPHRKNLYLLSNDPAQPRVRVPVLADVQLPLRVVEPTVVYAVGPQGEGTVKVHVAGLPGENTAWTVNRVRGFSTGKLQSLGDLKFEVQYSTGAAGERTAEVTVHHGGYDKPGKYVTPITIQTDHTENPQLLVQSVFDKGS